MALALLCTGGRGYADAPAAGCAGRAESCAALAAARRAEAAAAACASSRRAACSALRKHRVRERDLKRVASRTGWLT